MPAFIDLSGCRFGHLLVLTKSDHVSKEGCHLWVCRCDCGKLTTVKSGNLRSGHTISCGCYMKRRISETQSTHRDSHKRLYNVWSNMKSRCYNPKSTFYKDYGGRGITVCDEWKYDYSTFRDWAFRNGYDSEAARGVCTIDRINVDGNYCPENCRFVSMKVQRHNRRDSKAGVF